MLIWLIGFYTLYTLLRIYLSIMQAGYIDTQKRKKAVILPEGKYIVAGNYAIAKEKLSIVESLVEYAMFLWWVLYGFGLLQRVVGIDSGIVSSVLFVMGYFALNFIVSLPLDIYSRFVLDESFGFNKTTPRTFVMDTLKSSILFVIFGGAIFSALSWILEHMQNWWLWGFIFVFAVILLINLIYPTLIAPIFNKFTPLEDGELKDAIEKMMERVGLQSDGIFVMDASKRDSRLNAYFGGLGKSRRVVLFDTLLQKLEEKELLAVLGHELGHYRHGDIWKNIALSGLFVFVLFYIFGHIPQSLYTELDTVPTPGVTIALISIGMPLLGFIYTPLSSLISRHNEYEADRFGCELGGRENLVSALLKLVRENKAFPKSDPIYSRFYHTHPPILERLEALGYDIHDTEEEPTPGESPKDGIFSFISGDTEKER